MAEKRYLAGLDVGSTGCKIIVYDTDGNTLEQPEVSVMADVMFTAKYDNVGAREMRKLITAIFKEGNKHVSKTITWSVESFVANTRANSTNPKEIALVDAMLIYGDAVAAYMDASGL